MGVNKRFYPLRILLAVLLIGASLRADEGVSEGFKGFLKLRELYEKWEAGLLGSGPVYRRELYLFCLELVGKEMETDGDFTLLYPPEPGGLSVKCRLGLAGSYWLCIYGSPNAESNAGFIERSTSLFKIKGVVRKFRLNDSGGKTVDLWLDNITLAKVGVK